MVADMMSYGYCEYIQLNEGFSGIPAGRSGQWRKSALTL